MNPAPVRRARVVLLSGPSGSGKSSLAERAGLPVLQLDDFYKDGDDPSLPLLPDGSGIDWDSPASWHGDQALAAIRQLVETGRAEVPVYSIPANGRAGSRLLELHGAPAFIAEGSSPPNWSPAAAPRTCSATRSACATTRWSPPGAGSAAICARAASRSASWCGAAGG